VGALLLAVILLLGSLSCVSGDGTRTRYRPGRFEFDWPNHPSLTTPVRKSLDERLSLDTEILIVKLQDVVITDAVADANARSAPSFTQMMALEESWKSSEAGTALVETHTDSLCGRSLELLVRENSDFEEIVVTDLRGMIVCQSRMAQHFFYGDQDWWRECVETGQLSHSRLVYDENERSLGLSIFAPVRDPDTNEPIGVARALIRRRAEI
jgi:hypothetical protein